LCIPCRVEPGAFSHFSSLTALEALTLEDLYVGPPRPAEEAAAAAAGVVTPATAPSKELLEGLATLPAIKVSFRFFYTTSLR
jgi:hypothetical protein